MKLNEIVKQANGTYVGVKLDKESCKRIKELCKIIDVPNRVTTEKLHSTIIYSRKHVPELKADLTNYPIKAKAKEFHIFNAQDGKKALVLKLDCPALVDRHNHIMSEYGTTYDFPEYIPHVTISYDCGDFLPSDFDGELPEITFTSEYVEDLVLDWQNKVKEEKVHEQYRKLD